MQNVAQEYLNRVKDAIERTSALGRLSYWLEKHTTLGGKPYSFAGHEYQRDIIDSNHPNDVIIKPSQAGVSEGSARLALGFLAVSPDAVGIYTLPTVHESLRFSKSRVDPIIRGSKYLSGAMLSGSDSSSFKQIGSSQLFMAGTFGKALISIPTDLLINDEVDFSNAEVLVTAESRLSHSRFYNEALDIRGIRRKFSTPTLPSIGVSAMFDKSDMRRRMVRCRHCGGWFWPNFLQHVVVKGYDSSMEDITYTDVQDLEERGLLNTAQLLCEHCHKPITQANLGPDYREWVAERPHVLHSRGWAVSPFDLPSLHSPASLLRKKLEYQDEEGHFRNFSLGLPYADASNSVLPNAVKDNTCLSPVYPDSASAYGCVAGLDVGKTSWLVIGKPVGRELHVIWAERIQIKAGDEDLLFTTVVERLKQFRVLRFVCDGLPYTDTVLRIQARFDPGLVLPCGYTLTDKRLPMYKIQDSDHSLAANRTKTLDFIVKKINNGLAKFARFPELHTLTTHLQGMKRVDKLDNTSNWTSDWVKSGPDHYFHALNYMNMAASMVEETWDTAWAPPTTIVQAQVGRKAEQASVNPLALIR
jgi:hypothetical protein